MKKSVSIFFLVLFFTAAAFAGETAENMTKVMTEAGFREQQVSQVRNLINIAQQKGLPEEAITSKVHEGIVKGVPAGKIVQAVERVTSRYEYGYGLAEKLVNEKRQVAELGNTVAAGMAAGLKREDAEKIVSTLQNRSKDMNRTEVYSLAEETMLTARDMSRQGVSSETTAEVIGTAVQRGFDAGGMRTMRSSFTRQGGAHGNAESLARGYGTAIEQGIGAGNLAGHSEAGRGSGGMSGSEAGGGPGGGNSGGSGGGHR